MLAAAEAVSRLRLRAVLLAELKLAAPGLICGVSYIWSTIANYVFHSIGTFPSHIGNLTSTVILLNCCFDTLVSTLHIL